MRSVELPTELLRRIEDEARASYPDEACGFLIARAGGADGPSRSVRAVEPAPNEFEGERRRRFVISPGELRAAEARATDRGDVVCGFYHSHPDHPARPSVFDTEHAWPWYTYIVVSVDRAGVTETGAFELAPSGQRFERSPLRTDPDAPAGPSRVPLLSEES